MTFFFQYSNMLEQPQAGLIGRFYRQVENRPKNVLWRLLLFLLQVLHGITELPNILAFYDINQDAKFNFN